MSKPFPSRAEPASESLPGQAGPVPLSPGRRWRAALPRVFEALVVNAVPIWGLLFAGWSLSTMLFLYWLENLFNTFFIGARIWLHRRLTRKRGHWMAVELKATATVNGKPLAVPTTLLTNFVGSNLIFALAHGIFVALLVFGILERRPSPAALGRGVLWLLAAMTLAFLLDARTIRRQPFSWIRARVDGALGRMVVVHLALIGGVFFLAATGRETSFFLVFVLLKALFDLLSALPLGRPVVTDVRDLSAARRREEEEASAAPFD
jgi:hypothetical protein